jgi:predicted O-methyltransferase YrrM
MVTALKTAYERRSIGRRAVLGTLMVEGAPNLTARLQRLIGRPVPYDLQQHGVIVTSAADAANRVAGPGEWSSFADEYRAIEQRISERRATVMLRYPDFFAVESQTGLALYLLVRARQPACVVETGVADGLSTSIILEALRRNGKGEMHSLDVSSDVGALIEDRDGWKLHIVADSPEAALRQLLAEVPPIDMFFHDADHRFLNQLFEYETVARVAAPGALLASDDVNFSYAFDTFCVRRGLNPVYLLDATKLSGFVRL